MKRARYARFLRKNGLVLLTIFVFGVGCSTSQDVVTQTHLQAGNPDMRYLVWLPDGYGEDPSREYPLIVFLHGSGDGEYDSEFVISFGLPAVLQLGEQPDPFDFVVVSPQAEPGTAWWTDGQLAVLDGLVEDFTETYLVDRDRVYLTGLSMGGYGAWHLATTYPERFAAMASLSGSGYQSTDLPPGEFTCRLAPTPVWGIHGEKDLIAFYDPISNVVRQYVELCGAEVKWTTYPEAGHFETYERAYRDPALYEWLLGNRLSDRS